MVELTQLLQEHLTCIIPLTTVLTPLLRQLLLVPVDLVLQIVTSVLQLQTSLLVNMSSTSGHIRTQPLLPTWLQVHLVDLEVQAVQQHQLPHTGSSSMT